LLPQFKGYSLIDAIGKRMAQEPNRIFATKDLIDLLFVSERSNEQYAGALRSLTAELSRGAKEKRWYRIPGQKGQYRFEMGDIESDLSSDLSKERDPRELKRPQFRGTGYIGISVKILSQHPEGLRLEELAAEIFEFDSEAEKEKAQKSLSVELNRAIREKRLRKIDDLDIYCLPIAQEAETQA
jgi:hypothetical protein